MWLDLIGFAFIIALLRGGRLKETPKFNKIMYLALSVLLQIGSSLFHSVVGSILVSAAYLFTIIFFYFNSELEEIRVLMIGWLMNAIVIWANLGRMPVDITQAKKTPFDISALINGTDWKHTIINETTRLSFLSDTIYLPYPIPRVISIGDIFIALGMFLLIQRVMQKPISLLGLREGKINVAKN